LPALHIRGQYCVIWIVNTKPEHRHHALLLLQTEPWLSDREIARRVGLGNKTVSRLRRQEGIEREVGSGALRAAELALAAGVSLRQLRRWHENGLLPEPMRFWIGKRALLLYPPNSVQLVVTVKELMSRYRNVDRVALGLLAFGWPVSEPTVRTAYRHFLERQEQSFIPLASIFEALRTAKQGDPLTSVLDQAVAWIESTIRSHRLNWARRAAHIHTTDEISVTDATWEYLENVVKIMVSGDLGSDDAVRDLLAAFPLQSSMPTGEQVRVTKAAHNAIRLSSLSHIAAEAPIEEITQACDEVAELLVAYFALFDFGQYLVEGKEVSLPLSSAFTPDPSFLAVVGMWLVSLKRSPEIGPELCSWLDGMRDTTIDFIRFVLAQIAGAIPQLEALTFNYLGNRVGRKLLLTPPDD
jgi:hypothetical protein